MSEIDALFMTKYDRKGPSSRYRSIQYFPHLEDAGIRCTHAPMFLNTYLESLYETGERQLYHVLRSYVRRLRDLLRVRDFDVVVIEKELLPYTPALFERILSWLSVPYIVDYDDAIFHNYDRSDNPVVRKLLGRKIDVVMREADVVVAGNKYLAARARDVGASRIEIIPTVIDLEKYPDEPPECADGEFVIGWIGSPSTARFVEGIAPALREICERHEDVTMRLIGSGEVELPGVYHEVREWSEETEINDLRDIDVGIMPLEDSPWERGKCGLKLIQYMGCWKPVVASPVGVNQKIVTDGKTGYIASNREEWVSSLSELIKHPVQISELGRKGRNVAEERYCLNVTIQKWLELLKSVYYKRI